jgi:hypothetical protein
VCVCVCCVCVHVQHAHTDGYVHVLSLSLPPSPEAVLPDRALYLPTFSHLMIVDTLLSLSLSLSLSLYSQGGIRGITDLEEERQSDESPVRH